jgi:hypothetical protein
MKDGQGQQKAFMARIAARQAAAGIVVGKGRAESRGERIAGVRERLAKAATSSKAKGAGAGPSGGTARTNSPAGEASVRPVSAKSANAGAAAAATAKAAKAAIPRAGKVVTGMRKVLA